ncbi:hypothetical protein CDV31_000983 [Fusarium ambrosium]|uniref:Major facilitator superfamily (MFS) profile domain-containing protein n=1 Tax=Fusarium ambrosium TaxID=131363 RepID=A0A428V0W8_9HYPO|nr:hypothetical protein CDV31_000983 [Fusarium ambrosium]
MGSIRLVDFLEPSMLYIPDCYGRRWALFIGGVFYCIGGALQAGSVHMAMLLVARFLSGCGIGSLVTLTPLYQSDVSPTNIRGFLVGMHGVMLCTGYSIASWTGVGFYFLEGTNKQWRGPLAIQVVFPLLLCLGVFFLPESPRWLLVQDDGERAYHEFKRIHLSGGNDIDAQSIENEFILLRAQVAQEVKECLIGFLTFFAGQGTATLVINNYGPMLYSNLGFNSVQQLLIQSGWITVCPFANFVNSLIVDRFGRVRLLIFGLAGSIVALIGECIAVDVFQRTGSRGAASGAVFFLFLHIALFGLSYDATSYIYGSEIFPNPLRARGLGISITGLFVSTLIFLQSAPTAFTNISWRYYIVFIAFSTVALVIMWLFFPETNGKSLKDIAEVFSDNIVSEDDKLENIHRRFKESHYKEETLVNQIDPEKSTSVHRA